MLRLTRGHGGKGKGGKKDDLELKQQLPLEADDLYLRCDMQVLIHSPWDEDVTCLPPMFKPELANLLELTN